MAVQCPNCGSERVRVIRATFALDAALSPQGEAILTEQSVQATERVLCRCAPCGAVGPAEEFLVNDEAQAASTVQPRLLEGW